MPTLRSFRKIGDGLLKKISIPQANKYGEERLAQSRKGRKERQSLYSHKTLRSLRLSVALYLAIARKLSCYYGVSPGPG
jgi:hypothetical protein